MQEESYRRFWIWWALHLPKPAKVNTPIFVWRRADNMLKAPTKSGHGQRLPHTAEIIAGVAHNSMLETGWQAVAERILAC